MRASSASVASNAPVETAAIHENAAAADEVSTTIKQVTGSMMDLASKVEDLAGAAQDLTAQIAQIDTSAGKVDEEARNLAAMTLSGLHCHRMFAAMRQRVRRHPTHVVFKPFTLN